MDKEIEKDLLERIEGRLIDTELFDKNEKISFVISDYCKKSFYAPYYIGVYASDTKQGMINAGFVLQQLSVYLSAIGIASCYQAKSVFFKPVNSEGKVLVISLAMGYPNTSMYREVEEINRFKLDKICIKKEEPNDEVKRLIEIARIAPSSYNAQPWRFVVYNNRIHIFVKKHMIGNIERYKYINIGIMLGNIVLGSEELWIDIKFKELNELNRREYGNNEYIISLINKNTDGRIV